MLRHAIGAAVLALAFASADPAAAQRIKAGLLTCDVSGGIGLIIASQKQVSCVYAPDLPGPQEAYVGSFSRFGLDIGVISGFHYSVVIFAMILGYLVWSDVPDMLAFVGIGLIVGSGLYTMHRQQVLPDSQLKTTGGPPPA